jgi:hypothetical protein
MDLTENEDQTIKRTLRDRTAKASDRLRAAEYAGDVTLIDDELAGVLADVVGNSEEPEELRARAAIAVGPVLEECDMEGFDEPYSEPPIEKDTFDRVQETLRRVHDDESAPKEVRRRALEGSVRAPQDWHQGAVRAAYARRDREWQLTAAFCTGWIPGFDDEIMKMLDNPDPEIHCEAVRAAGERGIAAAWPHVAALVNSRGTARDLLLAAIEASGNINPEEAPSLLSKFAHSKDEAIAAAVSEALMNAEASIDPGDEEDDEDDEDEDEDEE